MAPHLRRLQPQRQLWQSPAAPGAAQRPPQAAIAAITIPLPSIAEAKAPSTTNTHLLPAAAVAAQPLLQAAIAAIATPPPSVGEAGAPPSQTTRGFPPHLRHTAIQPQSASPAAPVHPSTTPVTFQPLNNVRNAPLAPAEPTLATIPPRRLPPNKRAAAIRKICAFHMNGNLMLSHDDQQCHNTDCQLDHICKPYWQGVKTGQAYTEGMTSSMGGQRGGPSTWSAELQGIIP